MATLANLTARLERLEAAVTPLRDEHVIIVCHVAPGDDRWPRKLLGFRTYSPAECFPRAADETESQCKDRVIAVLKARGGNIFLNEDREETGPYCQWKRGEISESEYTRLVWGEETAPNKAAGPDRSMLDMLRIKPAAEPIM